MKACYNLARRISYFRPEQHGAVKKEASLTETIPAQARGFGQYFRDSVFGRIFSCLIVYGSLFQ